MKGVLYIDAWKEEIYQDDNKTKMRDSYKSRKEIKTLKIHMYLRYVVMDDLSPPDNVLAITLSLPDVYLEPWASLADLQSDI